MGIEQIKNIIGGLEKTIRVKALKVLAVEAEISVRKNFDVGGRPAWLPSKKSKRNKNTKTLVISGALKNVSAISDAEGVKLVIDPRARAYAEIHQFGGVINRAAGKVKLRKTARGNRFASSKHKRFKEVARKAYQINIPARPYLNIPQEDYPRILESVKMAITL
jgi:phage gpG-like protein